MSPTLAGKESPEVLIHRNGQLIEELFKSRGWTEIAFPLLLEMMASVSGRFTNGRFYRGDLTKEKARLEFLSGYQCALEDLYNRLDDFIVAKRDLAKRKKEEADSKTQPLVNPFLEEKEDFLNEEERQEM